MIGVSVIGIGRLGICLAAVFGKRFRVIGVDIREERVAEVNEGRVKSFEPHLEDYLKDSEIEATTDAEYAVANSDVSFIVVSTPSKPDGGFSNEYVENALKSMISALRDKERHLVVVNSTVMPGSMRGFSEFLNMDHVGLCYSPMFIGQGTVIRDMERPDFALIGESEKLDGDHLQRLLEGIVEPGTPFSRMSWENAELSKMALNAYVTTKISFANQLAEMCESLRGGDVDAVTGAIGLDSRIGLKYLRGGLGYGGPCFPRDNRAFIKAASDLGVESPIAIAVDAVNESRVKRVVDQIKDLKGRKLVLGITYKPGTDLTEDSQSLEIAELLGADVYDPSISDETLAENLIDADAIILGTPWSEFSRIKPGDLPDNCVVYDCWRALRDSFKNEKRYIGLGLNRV